MKLASLFSDHMVLQQGTPVPVWGWAPAGTAIAVEIAGVHAKGVAGPDGRWLAKLPPLSPGGPFELKANEILYRNVMIGEVWLCSGQSNMEMPVQEVFDAEQEIAAAHCPLIRLLKVPHQAVCTPSPDVETCWEVGSPQTIKAFSATAYFFARNLQHRLQIPIGLIQSCWEGTPAEAWTSRDGLVADPHFKKIIENYEQNLDTYSSRQTEYKVRLNAYKNGLVEDPPNRGFPQGWAAPGTPTCDWKDIQVPGYWQRSGHHFNGVLWFRREVDIPAAWAGRDLTLCLGACDKFDMTYFNNVQVGSLWIDQPAAWCTPREYAIPGILVKAGRNVVAVRIFSHWYSGGFTGPASEMTLTLAANSNELQLHLSGTWQCKVEHHHGLFEKPLGPGNAHTPAVLFNGMIHPLLPYAIRGILWYQGEANTGAAYRYRHLFPRLIQDWRNHWNQERLPFLFVQLSTRPAPCTETAESEWAELREAQQMALRLPDTGMAVAIDIGDITGHPRNKQEIGRRLALSALGAVYDFELDYSGPLYQSHQIEGAHIQIMFRHVGAGLFSKDGELKGFSIAGGDRKFVWADARIEGDTVVVASADVKEPVAVRYAWHDCPVCNLYNKAGLPASPFRTDDWPGVTAWTEAP